MGFLQCSQFQYPLNLHCSQTRYSILRILKSFNTLWIYTALKRAWPSTEYCIVSIPSEFTLLSNTCAGMPKKCKVSIPSEFTLLSNKNRRYISTSTVSIPSEFTLLSNPVIYGKKGIKFQYPLNLHCSQTLLTTFWAWICFNTLWIYTALKHDVVIASMIRCFNTLWIYTALKLVCAPRLETGCFNTLWIYTALKRSFCIHSG